MVGSIVVFGHEGMLGKDLVSYLKESGFTVLKAEVDITDSASVRELIITSNPSVVVNCAAYTDVAGAEDNVEKSLLVNGLAVENIARAVDEIDARLIHFSTDYVFPGTSGVPYTESDVVHPLNVYGWSKLVGDLACLKASKSVIFRLQWLYGRHGNSFIKKIVDRITTCGSVKVVADQYGCPTSTLFVSKIVVECLNRDDMRGLYHVAHDDSANWWEFAVKAVKLVGIISPNISSISTPPSSKVARPHRTLLNNTRLAEALGVTGFGGWVEGMNEYIEKYGSLVWPNDFSAPSTSSSSG